MNQEDIKRLQEKFFQDPDWGKMEELILEYIEPLKDMATVDTKAPAEHVKAEILGRLIAYDSLKKFVNDTRIVTRRIGISNNTFE